MSRVLTSKKLIKSVRDRTMCPDDTAIFTDQDILDIVNEEMDVEVLEKLITLHEEHLTVYVDVPRNSKGEYDIPYRAIGNKLRDVSLISGGHTHELTQVSVGSLSDYNYTQSSSSETDKFYIRSNKVVLINNNRSYGSIRFWFNLRPNVMVKEEETGIISSIVIDKVADSVKLTLSKVGKSFSVSELFDIVGKQTPNKIKTFDKLPTDLLIDNLTSGCIAFKYSDISDMVDDIVVGDFVCLAEQSPVANIPTELHPVLAQAAAIHILEAMNDTEALTNAQRRMMKMTTNIQTLIDDRVDLAPKKIKARHSALRQSIGSKINR